VSDEGRSGRPSTSGAQDHIEHTNALLPEDGRINASEVADKLNIRQLEPAIPNKRRRLLSKSVTLHYDNALPHTSTATIDNSKPQVRRSQTSTLQSRPRTVRLLKLRSLNKALRGRRFGSNDEVKEAVREQRNAYFSDGIKKLMDRKRVGMQGDRVEK